MEETVENKELADRKMLMIHATTYMTDKRIDQIIEETRKDEELQLLRQFIEQGWPNEKKLIPENIRKYQSYKEMLFIERGIIWKNHCIVIPKS